MPDQALRIAIGVQHSQKMWRQFAGGIFHREILLVIAHHRDQNFLRQRQKLRIETAQNGRRKLRQIHDRIEQRFIFSPARAGNRACRGIESLSNLVLALTAAQHLRRSQALEIYRTCLRNRHRAIAQNPMSARSLPCPNAVKLQRNRLPIEHRDQPAYRTHEALVGLLPVHILGPVNGGEFFGQALGENLSRAAAFFRDLGGDVFALGGGYSFQLSDVNAGLLGKCVGSRCRLAILICDVDRRPGDLLDDVGLRSCDSGRHHGQPPRAIEVRDFTARQPLTGQQRGDALAQFFGRRANHPRRNLFASDL